jgi:hypothetical protein
LRWSLYNFIKKRHGPYNIKKLAYVSVELKPWRVLSSPHLPLLSRKRLRLTPERWAKNKRLNSLYNVCFKHVTFWQIFTELRAMKDENQGSSAEYLLRHNLRPDVLMDRTCPYSVTIRIPLTLHPAINHNTISKFPNII